MRPEELLEVTKKYEELMYEAERYIWEHPETGYREWNTSAYLKKQFEMLGYSLTEAGNIPGFYADLDTGRPGPKVAVLGEMDSLIVKNHPACVPETYAVHACGHNAQCAILLGVAAVLKEPGVLDGLSGSVRLMAVPAEELIELGYREELRKQGVIRYYGGKVEFICRGYFDTVDMAMMIHAGCLEEGKALSISAGSNGCVTKNVTFQGRSAHAGCAPEQGRNALYAANCALSAANALRETFVDEEHIRFHPIITQGGLAVNSIPESVKVESYIRGASYDSIYQYNQKINQAMAGAAAALGCGVELCDRPGYLPLHNDQNLAEIMADAMRLAAGPDSVDFNGQWGGGSTDMGDVSSIMPAVHPQASGSVGIAHGSNYYIEDREKACLLPAQCLLLTLQMLLKEEARLGKRVIAESHPCFSSKEEYLQAVNRLTMEKEAVVYREDGNVLLDLKND